MPLPSSEGRSIGTASRTSPKEEPREGWRGLADAIRLSTAREPAHCIKTFLGHLTMSHEPIHIQNRAKTTLKDEQQTISHTIIESACALLELTLKLEKVRNMEKLNGSVPSPGTKALIANGTRYGATAGTSEEIASITPSSHSQIKSEKSPSPTQSTTEIGTGMHARTK